MRKMFYYFMIAIVPLVLLTFLPVRPAGGSSSLTRHIVYFQDAASPETTTREIVKHGGIISRPLPGKRQTGLVVYLPETAKKTIANLKGVRAIEPDPIVQVIRPFQKLSRGPQPAEVLPWGVDRLEAERIWDADGDLTADRGANTGKGVNVALIDSGIDKNHRDLKANLAGGINFVAKGPCEKVKPNDWNDEFGHGTHVAGICAAVENKIGVIGVGPGIRLWAVRVLDAQGAGYLSDVIDGIYWCADHGMQVINLSVGISKEVLDDPGLQNDKEAFEEAVNYAYAKGSVLVAAAGNEGWQGTDDNVVYPARFDAVIAVAATDQLDARPYWSSTGPAVEVAAPGVEILSTFNDGYYFVASGTSMASPHVAGTAALVIASGKVKDNDGLYGIANEVRELIRNSACDLGPAGIDRESGYGLVNAWKAVPGNNGD